LVKSIKKSFLAFSRDAPETGQTAVLSCIVICPVRDSAYLRDSARSCWSRRVFWSIRVVCVMSWSAASLY